MSNEEETVPVSANRGRLPLFLRPYACTVGLQVVKWAKKRHRKGPNTVLTREQLRKTEQWQSLNAIWRTLTQEQRQELGPRFRSLTEYLRRTAQPPRDFAAEDAAYLEELGSEARAFALEREREGLNVYDGLMKLVRRSSFEGPDKVLFFFQLRYGSKYPWIQGQREELEELMELVWRRSLERGFVPGEGFPAPGG